MKVNFILATLLTICFTGIFAQDSKIDSLQNELQLAESDTLGINILLELARYASTTEERLSYTTKALELSYSATSIKHKSRSEIIHGMIYAEVDLDSGINSIQNGVARYLENEMMNYAANAYFLKGVTYEIANKLDFAVSCYMTVYEIASKEEVHPEWGDAAYALANINNVREEM